MKKIWNMLRGKARRDNRGLSLVEVLCAVAILALVAGVIGTVIVVSTRTYRKGISETGIQQEAQLAANNIGNLVKDACSVVYGESGQQYIKNGSDLMTNSDTTPKMQADGTTELSIITNENMQYTVTYQRTDPADPHGRLFYQEFDSTTGSATSDLQIMANNIVDFSADTTDFKKSKTIKLKMTVEDETTNRRIPMEYTMTSRNDAVEGAVYVSHTDNVSILFPDGDIVLVPGETYQIPLVVAGTLTEGGLEWESAGGLTAGALTLDYAEVTVPVGTTATTETIVVHTKDKDEEGNYKAVASCNVIIRRVNRVEVSHVTDTTNSQGGMYETVGTVYTFTASVSGNELVKHVAYDYDRKYKTAQAVAWSCVLKVNGTESTYNWTSVQNEAGTWEFTAPDFTAGAFAQYFEVDAAATKEDALVPSFAIKVKETMPAGLELTVRATSKHALGVNKADSKYYDGLGYDPVNIYYGEDMLKPRATTLNQGLEITLEPHEKGEVAVGMKGGLTNDVTFEYHNATDLYTSTNPSGTKAVYNEVNDTVEITLGKDEKGSGPISTGDPYTFTIDVKVSGVTKSTITVHVCRIDDISIERFDFPADKNGGVMKYPTYDFRARLNVSTGNKDDMDLVVPYLIQYKKDGTVDSDAVKKTLSSRITWELIDHNNGSKVMYQDSVICMAGVGAGDNGTVGSYTKTYKKGNITYYTVENVKASRIEQDANGNWYIKQLPELDVSLSADTPTGLPANYEFKVTIEALHPLGTVGGKSYNKTDKLYKEGVEASMSIFGNMTISTPTQLVVVEPGQGTNSTEASEKEMVIPISVNGVAVYSMSATIDSSDRTSNDTKLAVYSGGNPYAAGNATSAGNARTWYLGLLIGDDEKGNIDGRIKVHVDAYNTSKEVIASTDFELGVRRVDKVDVKVADSKKIEDMNKEGSMVKLEAIPKGRGSNGTEFYDIQKDEKGSTYRWEQKGHGAYKEPSPMEWKMVIKGTEKPLAEWTQYIEKETITTSVSESDHKATVSFKLKQPLPNDAKIRAYSLHARGKVGETVYNKSEKNYAKKDIYGELSLGGLIIVSNEWKRGGKNNISYDIPEKNIYLNPSDGKEYVVDNNGNILWGAIIASDLTFKSKYNNQSTGNNILEGPATYNSGGVGGTRGLTDIEPTDKINEFWATLYGKNEQLADGSYAMEKYAFSSPYPTSKGGAAWWLDLSEIVVRVQIGVYGGISNFGNSDAILEAEETYSVADVVFQYANAPDAGGEWTDKGSNNALKVYVTPDDTISEYKSYYWLSEGWDDTAETEFDILPDRYVGVINDSDDDSKDERLFDFTTKKGMEKAGRCWVSFQFPDSVKKECANSNKVVKMTYEYNPFLCDTSNSLYGLYGKSELDKVNGCEGIIEFCFVKSNISGNFGGAKPSVMYCPTKAEVAKTTNPNDYYISTTERFHFSSDTQVSYQKYSGSSWTEQAKMTYNGSAWVVQ